MLSRGEAQLEVPMSGRSSRLLLGEVGARFVAAGDQLGLDVVQDPAFLDQIRDRGCPGVVDIAAGKLVEQRKVDFLMRENEGLGAHFSGLGGM